MEIDDLTGLYNMRGMYDRINLEISRNIRFGSGICAIMMDMDHFKRVNDDHDHLFGSFVLKEVGGIIKSSMRDVDFGARYGGDEFMVILTGTDYEGAMKYAERLRRSIEEYDFNNGEHRMDLTTSMGLAVLRPSVGRNLTAKELVQWADRALYESKETGRNRVKGFDLNEIDLDEKKAA
ncbi:MAG: GGDEF domain-containing protein [Bdellovibrionales bacterium]